MTETTTVEEATIPTEEEVAGDTPMEAAAKTPEEETEFDSTEEGRYIPYGGGCIGWVENQGVLKSELANNYLYHTVMRSDRIRSKQFQRFGERFNRRGDRERFVRLTGLTLATGKETVRGTTRDISRHGVRVQFTDEVHLKKHDLVKLQVHADETSEKVLFECEGTIAWCERVGKIRPLWNVGMTFLELKPDQVEKLKPMLHG